MEFIPGPISLILNKKKEISNITSANKNTIGIRIPDNQFVLSLLKQFKKPLATTSANLSNQSSPINIDNVTNIFKDKIQYYFDGGTSRFQKESTIVDLSKQIPLIIRAGVITKEDIETILKMKI